MFRSFVQSPSKTLSRFYRLLQISLAKTRSENPSRTALPAVLLGFQIGFNLEDLKGPASKGPTSQTTPKR